MSLESMRQFEEQFEMVDMDIEQEEDELGPPAETEYKEMVEDGPTEQDLQLWKKQFPLAKIFQAFLSDELFIYRTMNRVEYKDMNSRDNLNAITREEFIVRQCILWPDMNAKTIGESPAGNISVLAELVMKASGFDEPQEVVRLA